MKRKRGNRTGKSGPSKFLPVRESSTGATITSIVNILPKQRNALTTWRRRRAEALWKASQNPKPGTVIANEEAQQIARQIVDHLYQFAPCCLGGMVGNYWHAVLSHRALWLDEARQLASQVACLCRCATREGPVRRDVGTRSPKRAGKLPKETRDLSSLTPLQQAQVNEAREFAERNPNDRVAQEAYLDAIRELGA